MESTGIRTHDCQNRATWRNAPYLSIHPVKCCLPNAAHHALKSGMIHHPWPQFSHVPNPWPYLSLSNGGLPGRLKFKQPQVHNRILPYSAYSIFFYHRHFFVSDLGGFFMYVTHCHTYSSSMGAAGIVGKKKRQFVCSLSLRNAILAADWVWDVDW
jgi:hypothetical protein